VLAPAGSGAAEGAGRRGRRGGSRRRRPFTAAAGRHRRHRWRPLGRAARRRRSGGRVGRGDGACRPVRRWSVRAHVDLSLEPVHPLDERIERGVELGVGEPHQRHLEGDASVAHVAHLGDGVTEQLERSGDRRPAQLVSPVGRLLPGGVGEVVERPAHRGEEHVAQAREQASASGRGSRPTDMASATATMTAPVSRSHSASMTRSVDPPPDGTPPADTTCSSADKVSRADPPPWRKAYAMPSSSTSSPASAMTQRTCSASTSAGMRPNSSAGCGCGWWAAPCAGRWWPARTRRGAAGPRASSAARSTPPPTACGPRRGCTPSCAPASRCRCG
jgi:hypothetical protein